MSLWLRSPLALCSARVVSGLIVHVSVNTRLWNRVCSVAIFWHVLGAKELKPCLLGFYRAKPVSSGVPGISRPRRLTEALLALSQTWFLAQKKKSMPGYGATEVCEGLLSAMQVSVGCLRFLQAHKCPRFVSQYRQIRGLKPDRFCCKLDDVSSPVPLWIPLSSEHVSCMQVAGLAWP